MQPRILLPALLWMLALSGAGVGGGAVGIEAHIGGGVIGDAAVNGDLQNQVASGPASSTFDQDWVSGLSRISTEVTINSTTVTALFAYAGEDCDATDCDYYAGSTTPTQAVNLAIAGGGTDPNFNTGAPFTDGTTAVDFVGADYYEAAASTTGDLDTEDGCAEILLKFETNTADRIVDHKEWGGLGIGWEFFTTPSQITASFRGTGQAGVTHSTAVSSLTPGRWYLLHFCWDHGETSRADASRWGINGVSAGTSGTFDLLTASLSTATHNMRFGARQITQKCNHEVAWVALWAQDAWFPGGSSNTSQWDAFFAERAALWFGGEATASSGEGSPTVATRADEAPLCIYNGTNATDCYWVGDNWVPRVEKRADGFDAAGTGYNFARIAPAATNLITESQDLSTTWATVNSTVDADQQNDAFGDATLDDIDGSASDTQHGVSITVATTAAQHAFAVEHKAGNVSWAKLESTTDSAYCYFNGSSCTVGACSNAEGVKFKLNGTCRFGMIWTASSTPTNTLRALCAFANNDDDYTGAAGDCAIGNTQAEAGSFPTGPITTSGGTAGRATDRLYYSATSNVNDGNASFDVGFMMPDFDSPAAPVLAANVGAATDYVEVTTTSGDLAHCEVVDGSASQASIDGTTDVTDGTYRALRCISQNNNFRLYVAGSSEGTPDSSGTAPTSLTTVEIGGDEGGPEQPLWVGPINILDAAEAP